MKRINKILALAVVVLSPSLASALPFNDDMANTKAIRTGQMARAKPEGVVPVGGHQQTVATKEEALKLKNPNKANDPMAVENGERLFTVNCTPCHGYQDEKGVTPSAINARGAMVMAGPDLGTDMYAAREDGLFYGTIHFGGMVVMPRVGYKLSPKETWDIVSYIRSIQQGRKK
jgi:mono/diheme cytochrome c family protein